MPFSYEQAPPEYDGSDVSDMDEYATALHRQSKPTRARSSHFLSPYYSSSSNPSPIADSPLHSRATSPFNSRSFVSSASSSTYGSDTDETSAPLLRLRSSGQHWIKSQYWWSPVARPLRKRRRRLGSPGSVASCIHSIIRSPCFPTQPTTIILALFLLSLFALLVTVILVHALNPDKQPLPWREYCSIAPPFKRPPLLTSPTDTFVLDPHPEPPIFPPPNFENMPPVGIFLGVFSVDQAVERRMLIRSTWARHPRSRHGAEAPPDDQSTDRTIVRFILGKPSAKWERRIQLEMETYNDMIILPIQENMNSGKTHAFFSWASVNAWVPPLEYGVQPYPVSYLNSTGIPPALAHHDPDTPKSYRAWVRPDFIVKADDDSFVMLSELEAHLRVEMSEATSRHPDSSSVLASRPEHFRDPLIYWGYLVKNRFMAGELYALSWSIVNWVAVDPTLKGMVKGAEDKQVAKWMAKHPRAAEIRWSSEHCWIYDHPRAGTVYSHGFLFPSEVSRVRRQYRTFVERLRYDVAPYPDSGEEGLADGTNSRTPQLLPDQKMINDQLAYSTITTFGMRYKPPLPNLTPLQSIEALVEGSPMSWQRDNMVLGGAESAWNNREGRRKRYQEQRVGGTIVVHFIKRNEWFLETALALLEGEEVVEEERKRQTLEPERQMLLAMGESKQMPVSISH